MRDTAQRKKTMKSLLVRFKPGYKQIKLLFNSYDSENLSQTFKERIQRINNWNDDGRVLEIHIR